MTEIATIDWFRRWGTGGGHLFSLKTLLYLFIVVHVHVCM